MTDKKISDGSSGNEGSLGGVKSEPLADAKIVADKLRLKDTTRHIFLCTGKPEGKGGCCQQELGESAWKRLKEVSAEVNKELAPAGVLQRSAAKCLSVCTAGPIAVVYPEGVWYRNCSGENLEKIIERHLKHGEVVQELVLAQNPPDNAG